MVHMNTRILHKDIALVFEVNKEFLVSCKLISTNKTKNAMNNKTQQSLQSTDLFSSINIFSTLQNTITYWLYR